MSESMRPDPRLQSFEAQLGAMSWQLPVGEQRQLLYQCAFAAGKQAASARLRSWQLATAALLLLLTGVSVPRALPPWGRTAQQNELTVAANARQSPTATVVTTPKTVPQSQPALAVLELGAWPLRCARAHDLSDELAQLNASDPRLRALTVGGMTTALQSP
jgi:hypothetical protein